LLAIAAGAFASLYLSDAPARARAEMARGMSQMGPGKYDQAIRSFDRAIEIWPEFAEAYLYRAVAEHGSGQGAAALADLDKALDLDPNLTRAYNERGLIYLENADPKKAIGDFNRSIAANPSLDGYYQRGQAYEALRDHSAAIASYDAAINEFRDAPYIYRARAAAKRNAGDRDGALADEQSADQIEAEAH